MSLPGAIDYRRCCLILLILVCYFHVTISITVIDHASKEQGAEGRSTAAVDDTHSEKAEDEEAEDKHFMDAYSLQSGPQQLEFGHVFEDPNVWEQRYEKKDFDSQRYQGKVKWGDKDGSYGEQYWDLNHGGAGESANDKNENESNGETSPTEYYGQETRRRAVVYAPVVIKFIKNRSKKPVRNIRNNNSKRILDPSAVAQTTIGNSIKKKAPVLVFDMKTGVVMDESTGNKFILQPLKDN